MSPSESQLRAALHEGEGDALDAGLLVAHAHRLRRERRQRVNRLAGATLAIGLIGGGLMLLGRTTGDESGGASSEGGAAGSFAASRTAPGALAPAPEGSSPAKGGSAGGSGGFGHGSAPVSGTTRTCPPVPDRIEFPTSQQDDSYSGALVPFNAKSIRACAYPSGALHRSVVLQADAARAFASTVNAGAIRPTPSKRTCTDYEPAGTLELLPVTAMGKPAKPVLVTVACPNAIASNGAAVRYFVVTPKLLSNLLR